MKTILLISAIFIFISCNDSTTDSKTGSMGNDTTSVTPALNDTTAQPSGVDNSSVISTDTAAINVQNSIKKADSAKGKQ